MARTDVHADFARAASHEKWTRDLRSLWTSLNQRAGMRPGEFVRVVLIGGAWVGLRVAAGEPRVLRIFRRDPPKDDPGGEKWRAEVATFLKHFGASDWPVEYGEYSGGPMATATEPATLGLGE